MTNNPEQILTIATQYIEQLQTAQAREDILDRMNWYRETAAPLFKPGQ